MNSLDCRVLYTVQKSTKLLDTSDAVEFSSVRKPREKDSIFYSPLRPLVPAKHRLKCWSTPYSVYYQEEMSKCFSESAYRRLLEVTLDSLAPKTCSTYAAGLLRFTQFCDKYNISEDIRMPASSNLLAMFLAESAAGKVSLEGAMNWMAGLHFWHNLHGAPWHGDNDQIRSIIRGVKKLTPSTSKRPQRGPVTMAHMYALRQALSTSNSKEVAMLALAEATFWGTCRLGETVPPSTQGFNSAYHVSKGCSIKEGLSQNGVPFLSFHIPWSKTTGFEGADIVLVGRDDFSNPIQSFLWHRKVNSSVPDGAPLFAYETIDGGWNTWTRASFLEACNKIWLEAGLACLFGHSFRIGNTTELLLQGVEPSIVAIKGRWKSKSSFLRYWRKIDEILPLFLNKDKSSDLERLRSVFKMYENRTDSF